MEAPELIDHHQLSRALHYWRLRCLRRIRIGNGMIYNQTVGSLNAAHEQIPPLYTGDAERGRQIELDRFPVGDEDTLSLLDFWSTRHKQAESGMRRSGFSACAIHWINRFDWLADVHALAEARANEPPPDDELDLKYKDLDKVSDFCVNTLKSWIRSHQYWTPLTWHVPTLAQRINNWLYFYKEFFGAAVNTSFDGLFFSSISKQLDHLHTSVLHETEGFEQIVSLGCWVNTGLCISSEEKRLSEGITLLSIALRALFQKPHQELLASPRLVYETHHILYHISKGFLRQQLSIPPEIDLALHRLEALLQEYTMPDHTLARFHNSWDVAAKSIKIGRKSSKNKSIASRSKPALLKSCHDKFTILLDTSSCPKNGQTRYRHLSPLAMELYDGQQPLIINLSPPCNNTLLDQQEYRDSAFHSMPQLEHPRLGTIRPDQNLEAYYTIASETISEDGVEGQRIICRHDGYLKTIGGTLERRLNIWNDPEYGTVIQGCDTLEFKEEPRTDDSLCLVSLFHLHPNLEPTQLQGGGILIRRQKPATTWHIEPIGKKRKFSTIRNLVHYQEGLNPQKINSIWMRKSITHPQNLARYCNEWAVFRAKK